MADIRHHTDNETSAGSFGFSEHFPNSLSVLLPPFLDLDLFPWRSRKSDGNESFFFCGCLSNGVTVWRHIWRRQADVNKLNRSGITHLIKARCATARAAGYNAEPLLQATCQIQTCRLSMCIVHRTGYSEFYERTQTPRPTARHPRRLTLIPFTACSRSRHMNAFILMFPGSTPHPLFFSWLYCILIISTIGRKVYSWKKENFVLRPRN